MSGDHPTHVVALSGVGRAAVATILVEGPASAALIEPRFQSRFVSARSMHINRIHFGTWQWSGQLEDLVVCRTGADQFEIHCHGGMMAVRNIIDSLTTTGATEMDVFRWLESRPQQSSIDLAKKLLPSVVTERTTGILLDQIRGAMDGAIADIRTAIDSDDREAARQRLDAISAQESVGEHLVRGWSIVIAGPPNVGKSSLINRLLGYERAIVFDQPGTTRDLISVDTAFDGWPVTITDTAGLRDTTDPIEQEGVRLARMQLANADLVLLLSELSQEAHGRDTNALQEVEAERRLLVATKADLHPDGADGDFDIVTSSSTGQGIDRLINAVVRTLIPNPPRAGDAIPLSKLVASRLRDANACIANGDTSNAIAILASIEHRS